MNKLPLLAMQLFLLLTACLANAQNQNVQFRSKLSYPGQTLANVCGYAANGREYGLLGGSQGLIIVDVTNPDAPTTIVQIPGPNNLWKEIKTYSHYAYVTSEGGEGVQIVDLNGLPGSTLNYHHYKGDGAIAGQLNTIHALHIDVTKGYLYAYGSNLFQGGAVVLDLNQDPYNPVYVGKFNELGYIHDGYVDNDTLYAGHINAGILSIVDMTNKAAPVVLGTVQTPGRFTHNAWITDDRKHILTTDETTPSFLTSYDVSDPGDIKELDRYSPNDGNQTYVHNTHILNDYAVTSWYTDGITVVDAHRPDNLVMIGIYDTYPQGGALQFEGCWGVYPYLPSGNLITTNITPGDMYVLTPTYKRACYLEGIVKESCNNAPLADATINISSNDSGADTKTNIQGVFKTGQAESGTFTVTISKLGYASKTFNVTLVPGEVVNLNVVLEVQSATSINGVLLDASTNTALANQPLTLTGTNGVYKAQTNGNGQFNIDCIPAGDYQAFSVWGYGITNVTVAPNGNLTVSLTKGYVDDFAVDYGWISESLATSGDWVLGEPVGTQNNQGEQINPEEDILSDANDQCYVTGNGGGGPGTDDVDNGMVTLTCPPMDLSGYYTGKLSFWYWFRNLGGTGTPNDKFEVSVSNGGPFVNVLSTTLSQASWLYSGEIDLASYIPMSSQIRVRFVTADDAPGHVVEAAVDGFKVIPYGSVGLGSLENKAYLNAFPNPFTDAFTLQYGQENGQNLRLDVFNGLGQLIETKQLNAEAGVLELGSAWLKGIYWVKLSAAGDAIKTLRLVRQ